MAAIEGIFSAAQAFGFRVPGFKVKSNFESNREPQGIAKTTKPRPTLDEHEIRARCDAWSELSLYVPTVPM